MSASAEADSLGGRGGSADEKPAPNAGVGSSSGGAPTGDLGPTDNGVIIVHAAEALPFRLCFDNERALRPMPDAQAMPKANVVGVEVGNAVRVPPLAGVPGKIWLFEEPGIRTQYFNVQNGGKGPSCKELLESSTLGPLAIDVGDVSTDLKTGVHLLVVKGCAKDTPGAKHSVARCGTDWTPASGNLRVQEITLSGYYRKDPKTIPTQVINLSPALESARGVRPLTISYGALGSGTPTTVATNPELFKGVAPDAPVLLPFDPDDQAKYASMGFRVSVPAGAGPGIDVDYSLAELQKLSAPTEVPSSYYTVASNYVMLLLGNPGAALPDGGPDTDPRRALHFLVVPVIEPKPDAGTDDAGTDAP